MNEGDVIEVNGYRAKMSVGEVREIIVEMERRFEALWERVRWRREHLHNLSTADPVLPAQYADVQPFQSDAPRRIGQKLKSRLVENQYVVRANPPRDNAKLRKSANDLEHILMSSKTLIEERFGIDIQGGLASGAVEDCYGVLHWHFDTDGYPEMGEAEYRDELGEYDDEDAFTPLYKDDDEDEESGFPYRMTPEGMLDFGENGSLRRRKVSRYKETDDALAERWKKACASAGFPMYVGHVPADMFAFIEDRKPSAQGQFAFAMLVQEVPVIQYMRALEEKRKKKGVEEENILSVNESNPDVPVYREQPGPRIWEPSYGGYGEIVRVYQLWTRDECYEVMGGAAGLSQSPGQITDAWRHPYGEPPFAIAYGNINLTTFDPVLRYEPALEGVYRIKPVYDRAMTLLQALVESVALPYFYWKNTTTGEAFLGETGEIRMLTRNAVGAEKAPQGYELAALPYEINPMVVNALDLLRQEFQEAFPSAGEAEITASTQPWAIRLSQAQAAVEPKMLLDNIARCITKFERNKAKVMSCPVEDGGPGEIFLYGKSKSGQPDRETVISIKPEQIRAIDVSVDIKGSSEAEQITKEAHGREMLQAGTITMADYLENYRGVPDPDEYQLALDEEYAFNGFIRDQKLKQLLAVNGLLDFMLGPNGDAVGMGGQPAAPQQVLAANGWQPGGQTFQPGQQSLPQTQMGDMAGLQTPGSVPLPGVPG